VKSISERPIQRVRIRGANNSRSNAIIKPESKKAWVATPTAFRQFLAWLDDGHDSGGATYLDMRRRLVLYFRRKRCLAPDELADETLNRVARRLEEEGAITDASPAHYCYIVAKFVFLEYLRQSAQSRAGLAESRRTPEPEPPADDQEQRLDCLDQCLERLSADDQALILDYYRGTQRERIEARRALAARLALSPNALTIRACRIREKLVACLRNCSGEK
jgi:DNA-directed RNA polymerase specialized sigma24 family protein